MAKSKIGIIVSTAASDDLPTIIDPSWPTRCIKASSVLSLAEHRAISQPILWFNQQRIATEV
jgi:hypothetical protein